MPLVPVVCTRCGGNLQVNSEQEVSVCPYCRLKFVTENAIDNSMHNQINAQVVNIYHTVPEDSASSSQTAIISQGNTVFAHWAHNNYYYPAIIDNISGDQIKVSFLDGDKATVTQSSIIGLEVAYNTLLFEGNWKNRGTWYKGVLSSSNMVMNYNDGDVEHVHLRQLRGSKSGEKVRGAGVDGGCYIATAIYGSYNSPKVVILRSYRDSVLKTTLWGKLFIAIYYAVSPAFVKLFGNMKWFNSFFRKCLDRFTQKYGD